MSNPFIYGRTLRPAEFIGRQAELRWTLDKLATEQSVALVGAPHMGKTSFLAALMDEATRRNLVGNTFDHTLFSLLDGHALHGIKSPSAFWQLALRPLVEAIQTPAFAPLATPYEVAANNAFGTFVLEKLFRELHKIGWRFVLALDEFDALLGHDVLNAAEFYGGLRALSSQGEGLTLLIASRHELADLASRTQAITHGSPYFNTFVEQSLGMLEGRDLAELLDLGLPDKPDRVFVAEVCGGHPYLAQVAGAMVWDAHKEKGAARYAQAMKAFRQQTNLHFKDTWDSWSTAQKRALTAVTLGYLPHLLGERAFHRPRLEKEQDAYAPELSRLEQIGVIRYEVNGRYWMVAQLGFVWWLTDELWRTIRTEQEFGAWLTAQQFEGLLTREEWEWMTKAFTAVAQFTPKLAEEFIKKIVG